MPRRRYAPLPPRNDGVVDFCRRRQGGPRPQPRTETSCGSEGRPRARHIVIEELKCRRIDYEETDEHEQDDEILAARDRKVEAARAKRKERRQATRKETPEQIPCELQYTVVS